MNKENSIHISHKSQSPIILHVWDTKFSLAFDIQAVLMNEHLVQHCVCRVLITPSEEIVNQNQTSMFSLTEIVSPFPQNFIHRLISHYKFRKLVERRIKEINPDLIIFHFGQTAASLIKLCLKYDVGFLVAIYGHDISAAPKKLRWRLKYRIFGSGNGRFLVLSEHIKSRLSNFNIPPEKITVYNHPLDLRIYGSIQKKTNTSTFRLTIPARLVEKKGHPILFESMRILKERGMWVHLNVLGYGEKLEEYKSMVNELGITDQINWVNTKAATISGKFDEVFSDFLEITDLVVLPSITASNGDNEAGPALVLCLAQASGTPVLTTPFEGHEISISHLVTGILSTENDSSDLAEKIEWCSLNRSELREIGNRGQDKVLDVFSNSQTIQSLLAAIEMELR
jgi:colanic acid/amylovoran biosynthesis glycosyltransferase